jgi:aminopeptidase N
MFRRVAALVTVALTLGPVGSAAAFEPAQQGPQPGQHTDSVYPSVGSPGVDVRAYGLDLRWEPGSRTLRGTARVTLVPARDGRFRLDLSGRLHVDRVDVTARATGAPVTATASHRGRYLDVTAPQLLGGSTYDVRVSYHGRPATTPAPTSREDLGGLGWHTARDGQVWAMQEPWGAFTWYPVNDHPSDKATYRVRLDVPRRWVGVSNGRLVSRRVQHGRTVTRFASSDPVASYLMTVAIGPYRRATQTGPHGLPLTYWVPRDHPEYLAPLRATPSAIAWLESRLGPYPFDRAGVVVTPSDSAMETQTLVTFGARNYRLGAREVRQTVVHELAHHWYGDTVTPDDWRDLWMNEGMAMYLQERWDDAHSDRRHEDLARTMRQWARIDQDLRDLYGPPGAYVKDEFASANVYLCAGLMWHRLRGRLGAETFDRLVRRWPQSHVNTNADRADLVRWWERQSGAELSAFFDRWLNSPESPA